MLSRAIQKMLELNPRPMLNAPQARTPQERKQPYRLVLALVLLLVALVGVVVKDRDFWFGSDQSTLDSNVAEPASAQPAPAKAIATVTARQSAAPAATKKSVPAAKSPVEAQPSDAPVVATNRTVLPPLDVEVVAGDKHRKLHPGSNATRVEITEPSSEPSNGSGATNAAERESLAVAAPQAQPAYPLLAQHMNVQGSVVLQALIGADGVIENLHVQSGPSILASAAQQAVREWHFKPVLQKGQAVETKATITVNFNIKVADGTAKATIAENQSDRILVLSR